MNGWIYKWISNHSEAYATWIEEQSPGYHLVQSGLPSFLTVWV